MRKIETIILEVTNRCNANCVFCARGLIETCQDMDFEFFKSVIDAAPKTVKRVHTQGFGEPLLYPHIVDAVQYVSDAGMEPVFYTNGSLLTSELSKELLGAGLGLIIFSVDSATKEEYEQLRRGLCWDTVVRNVLTFQELRDEGGHKTKTAVRMCRTKENDKNIDSSVAFWSQYVDQVTVSPEVNIVSPSEIKGRPFATKGAGRIKCRQVNTQLVVRANGCVVLCCVDWFGCYKTDDLSGYEDITTRLLVDIFNDKTLESVRAQLRKRGASMVPTICLSCKGQVRPERGQ